jgi:hypothetical protein
MAHPDPNALLNDLLPFAERMLRERGKFSHELISSTATRAYLIELIRFDYKMAPDLMSPPRQEEHAD